METLWWLGYRVICWCLIIFIGKLSTGAWGHWGTRFFIRGSYRTRKWDSAPVSSLACVACPCPQLDGPTGSETDKMRRKCLSWSIKTLGSPPRRSSHSRYCHTKNCGSKSCKNGCFFWRSNLHLWIFEHKIRSAWYFSPNIVKSRHSHFASNEHIHFLGSVLRLYGAPMGYTITADSDEAEILDQHEDSSWLY